MDLMEFYRGKNILITGHTGFKGSWMCKVLQLAGANVTGYALRPPTVPNLFNLIGIEKKMQSLEGDIRDISSLEKVFHDVKPEIVFHLAAQPLVRESYKNPVYTYEVNVLGTVNVLECIRNEESVRSFVNITTDKVYKNKEWCWGYRESEELNGFDPYSNSKACSELVTSSYKNSFFNEKKIGLSTARAGNVIGGGDFAVDRIIPDCIRSVEMNKHISVRNPYSIRPYEHVLEPISAYLLLAKAQYDNISYAGNYNIGPNECDCISTGELVTLFCEKWSKISGKQISWINEYDGGPHEAEFLKLDCSKIKQVLNWEPHWNIETAMEKIVEWTYLYLLGEDVNGCMEQQIKEFFREVKI